MERSGFSVHPSSEHFVRDGKFVELTYKVTDRRSGHVLTRVEFPNIVPEWAITCQPPEQVALLVD